MTNPTGINQPDHIVDMHEMVADTNQASEVREGGAPISDKEAWLRIFETIRPTIRSTVHAISSTNDTFDAMKNKLEVEL